MLATIHFVVFGNNLWFHMHPHVLIIAITCAVVILRSGWRSMTQFGRICGCHVWLAGNYNGRDYVPWTCATIGGLHGHVYTWLLFAPVTCQMTASHSQPLQPASHMTDSPTLESVA